MALVIALCNRIRSSPTSGDVIKTNLTFAVWLTDEFTQQGPAGQCPGDDARRELRATVRNLSGYFLFTDLIPGTIHLRVESDFYLPAEQAVDTTILDPKHPVAEIVLKPTPRYPFPGSATLLRGVVTNGTPVAGGEGQRHRQDHNDGHGRTRGVCSLF